MRLNDVLQDAGLPTHGGSRAAGPLYPASEPHPDRGALGYPEAAAYLGVSPRTVRQLVHDGAIPSFTIGSRRLINRERLDEYRLAEEARQQAPRSKPRALRLATRR